MCVDTIIMEAISDLVGFFIADLVTFSLWENPRFLDFQYRITYHGIKNSLENHVV